jgi:hypothetical protein
MLIAKALQRTLLWEAMYNGMSVLCGSNNLPMWYVFSFVFCHALGTVYLAVCSPITCLFPQLLCMFMLLVLYARPPPYYVLYGRFRQAETGLVLHLLFHP